MAVLLALAALVGVFAFYWGLDRLAVELDRPAPAPVEDEEVDDGLPF